MFIFGASTARVGEVVRRSPAPNPSVNRFAGLPHPGRRVRGLENAPTGSHYAYLFADGTYFSVIYDGEGQKMPILTVIGIRLLASAKSGFSVGERENQAAWEDLFAELKGRGLQQVGLWISDGHQAMLNAWPSSSPHAAPALYQAQDGQRLGLCPRQTARAAGG